MTLHYTVPFMPPCLVWITLATDFVPKKKPGTTDFVLNIRPFICSNPRQKTHLSSATPIPIPIRPNRGKTPTHLSSDPNSRKPRPQCQIQPEPSLLRTVGSKHVVMYHCFLWRNARNLQGLSSFQPFSFTTWARSGVWTNEKLRPVLKPSRTTNMLWVDKKGRRKERPKV